MANTPVSVPDLGGIDEVEVIEICVKSGDNIEAEEALIVLESDKATMEVPAPFSGVVAEIKVNLGDKVSTGSLVAEMSGADASPTETASEPAQQEPVTEPQADTPKQQIQSTPSEMDVVVPDLGGIDQVEVIELCVSVGDSIEAEESLFVLESDKATMEIPAPQSGKVLALSVAVGDKVSQGDMVGKLAIEASASEISAPSQKAQQETTTQPTTSAPKKSEPASTTAEPVTSSGSVHAGPAVRKLARELGVDLSQVTGTGPRSRIQKQDLHDFVKQRVNAPASGPLTVKGSDEDFSKHGPVSSQPLNKIKQVTARNMLQSWSTIPQVTQFDEADITELEAYRKAKMAEQLDGSVKVSPLAFIVKACVKALQTFPEFNSSLSANADSLILKQYYNIGIAVDTPEGLLVPVIKEADEKGVVEIAKASSVLAQKARDKKLPMDAMSGASFTISSLGGIGGTAFTPIVNAPQVAILGVSKASYKPVWNGKEFEPRLMLPLSLSYDHRVIDGAQAAKFTRFLCELLTETRHMLL